MKRHALIISLALLVAAFLGGCQKQGSAPVGPEEVGNLLLKGPGPCEGKNKNDPGCDGGGNGGGTKVTWSFAEARIGDSGFEDDLSNVVSTCDGTPTDKKASRPTVFWNDDEDDPAAKGCVTVTVTSKGGTVTVLKNDAQLILAGKGGTIITDFQFLIQDFGGADGTQYQTDRFPIEPDLSGVFTGADFILHVHQENVPIYKLSGHTGGKRVAEVGTINIGDIFYK